MDYILWCDESDKKGPIYSHFYGGALIAAKDVDFIVAALNDKKADLNMHGEIKWTKISENYKEKYIEIVRLFFDFLRQEKIKVRIMFSDNVRVPILRAEQKGNSFFKLYYQFIKHAFGLTRTRHSERSRLIINFDKIPDTKEKSDEFKAWIFYLNTFFNRNNLFIERHHISEVVSHNHVVLQCLDIILGSMAFRLNKKNEIKPTGARCRGRKTLAKDSVYKFINSQIRSLYPDYCFNIGINTGNHTYPYPGCYWTMPYRHWVFAPSASELDPSKKKRPDAPY